MCVPNVIAIHSIVCANMNGNPSRKYEDISLKAKPVNPLMAEEMSEDHRRLHRLGTMNVYTKLNGNSSSSSWDISIWTNTATSRAMPKALVINRARPIHWLANIIGLSEI